MANNYYITAGLPVAKNAGQSPGAGDNTFYATAGLPPVILEAPSGGAQVIIIMSKNDTENLTRPVISCVCLMGSYTRRNFMKRVALSILPWT